MAWSKLSAPSQRVILGVDVGSPDGDMSAVAFRSPSGAVTITTVDSPDPVVVDLELQPDGTYAPAQKSHLPTRPRK